MIGKLANDPFVGQVKNGEAKALFAQVQFSHDGEVRTVQVFPGMGEDSWPCKGDTVAVEKAGGFYYVSGVWDGAEPKRKPGEREIYSRDGLKNKAADLLLENNGNASLTSNSAAGKQAELAMDASGAVLAAMTAGSNAAVHALKSGGTHYLGNALMGQDISTVMNTYLTALNAFIATVLTALQTAVSPTPAGPPPTEDPGALTAFSSILPAAVALQAAVGTLQAQWGMIFDPVLPVKTGG
jgi:hypothetical protein